MGNLFKVLIISFVFIALSADVLAENSSFSLSDFPVRKVNIEKTPEQSSKKPSVISENTTKAGIDFKKDVPKTRPANYVENVQKEKRTYSRPAVVHEQTNAVQQQIVPNPVAQTPQKQVVAEPSAQQGENITGSVTDDKIDRINSNNQVTAKLKKTGTGSYFLRSLTGLSVVLLLIFVFAWLYAKFKGINPSAILTGKFSEKDLNRFNILSTSTLGQGKDIHLVEINGKQLVIGSTASNVNLLTEISTEEVEKLKAKKHETAYSADNHIKEEQNYPEPPVKNNIEDSELFNNNHINLFDEDISEKEITEEVTEEDESFSDSDYYSSKYSDVYKDYKQGQ